MFIHGYFIFCLFVTDEFSIFVNSLIVNLIGFVKK